MERRKNSRDQKKAKQRNALIFFADESSFNVFPNLVRSYFRKGCPATLTRYLKYESVSVISAISPCGQLIYQIRTSRFLGRHMADFLRTVLKTCSRRKVILIWDGVTTHFSEEVKELLRCLQPEKLELYKLPAHSPELNPDEQVWKYLKGETVLRNLACKSFKDELGLTFYA